MFDFDSILNRADRSISTFRFSGGLPVALLSRSRITILGNLSADAYGSYGGAGGIDGSGSGNLGPGSGPGAGQYGNGGGSFGGAGGVNGGPTYGDLSVALVGGSGGANGLFDRHAAGGGGGALELGAITISATVSASFSRTER